MSVLPADASGKSLIFDLKVATVPLLNARGEFGRMYRLLNSPDFRGQIEQWKFGDPIQADYIIWGGEPRIVLTWFLQRAIIGLEAYIPGAVFMAAVHYGRCTDEVQKAIRDPFSLNCESAANTFYNCLPATVEMNFRMKRSRASTWKQILIFYQQIRNPLFHGSQLDTEGHKHVETLDAVLRAFNLFIAVYKWLDWWCPPRLFNLVGEVPISQPPTLYELEPE